MLIERVPPLRGVEGADRLIHAVLREDIWHMTDCLNYIEDDRGTYIHYMTKVPNWLPLARVNCLQCLRRHG